jgi:hypothetical protein
MKGEEMIRSLNNNTFKEDTKFNVVKLNDGKKSPEIKFLGCRTFKELRQNFTGKMLVVNKHRHSMKFLEFEMV